jgi:hypothetical protein
MAIFLGFISAFIPILCAFSINSSDTYPASKLKIDVPIIFSISLYSGINKVYNCRIKLGGFPPNLQCCQLKKFAIFKSF